MELTADILKYIEEHQQQAQDLLLELAQIPAPSHHEEKRAQFCLDWLKQQGAQGVYIDDALNVVYPVGCSDDCELVVYMAHSDVVFPDTDPLPLTVREGKVFCPGITDDTANAAALLMAAKYVAQQGLLPQNVGVLLIINSCEEGLGNLKGCRRIMQQYGSRVREFVTFDAASRKSVNVAVGSRRFHITVRTEGGHSYNNFGNRNAIACLSDMIHDLYQVQVPPQGKTTYNVGTITGGTSVNTIAQQAEMLYEFRSDVRQSLDIMQGHLDAVLEKYRAKGLDLEVELVGDRPCMGDVDPHRQQVLEKRASDAVLHGFGQPAEYVSGSTDCNIPLSMGIPSVCVGCCDGAGAHTREEWMYLDSLQSGVRVAFELILHHF